MRAVLIVVALLPALAFAQKAKPRWATRIVLADELEGVRTAVDGVQAALDKCWKKPATAKATVTFENGKASTVVVTESGDPKTTACITKVLRGAVLANASSRVTATLELTAERVKMTKDGKIIENIRAIEPTYLGKFTSIEKGSGVGKGSGGGGKVEGDFVAKGTAERPATGPSSPNVVVGPSQETDNGISADDINRVIRARAGAFRACYQRELERTPGLAGKVTIRFEIALDGSAKTGKVISSTMKAPSVESCLVGQIMRLKFPASAKPSTVTYPFVFSNA
jgi:hypothetical protein